MDKSLVQFIGREVSYIAPDELGAASIRYFASATEDSNLIYRDETLAGQSRHKGIIAPPTFICETNQIYESQCDQSRSFGHDWNLPLNDRRVIRGGNEYEFLRPVRPSDRITVRWKFLDISEKMTKNFESLIVVTSKAFYHDHSNNLIATNNETMIYVP